MALSKLVKFKLPDVPLTADPALHHFLMELKRVVTRMSGEGALGDRVLTVGDLQELGLTVPRWNDLRFPAMGQQVDTAAGKLDYDFINCGVNYASTASYPSDPICHVVQLEHNKVLGSELRPHIHWEQNQNATPNWLLEWRWVNNGEVRGAYQTAAYSHSVFSYTSGNLQQITVFPPIPAILREHFSSVLDVRLFRDSSNSSGLFAGADPYTGDALLKEFDIHIFGNSFGTINEYAN